MVAIKVEKKEDVVEDIKFSLAGESNREDTTFTPIENVDGGAIFTGETYSYIYLPNDLGPIAILAFRIIHPAPSSEYRVKFYGCAGKHFLLNLFFFIIIHFLEENNSNCCLVF